MRRQASPRPWIQASLFPTAALCVDNLRPLDVHTLVRHRLRLSAFVFALIGMLTGCATERLWQSPAFDGFNEPAIPANLQIYKATDDFLIQYDELRERNDRVYRRAYYLKSNSDVIAQRRMPHFVRASRNPQFAAVPVYEASTRSALSVDSNALHAVISSTGQEFTLYSGPGKVGSYELPTYAARSGRVKQLLLTPATAAADLTIVGGYLGLWWLRCGAPGLAEYH